MILSLMIIGPRIDAARGLADSSFSACSWRSLSEYRP